MSRQRWPIFADELARFAVDVADPRVTAISQRAAAPLRVAVCGRRGVGRRTVAHALRCAGATITPEHGADVVVYVVAEVVKPEDTAAVAALRRPAVAVRNKADLAGCADPAEISRRLGAPAEPMAGLLAVFALRNPPGDGVWDALRVLAAEPADVTSPERFVAGPHRVPRRVRSRLCEALGLPGILRLLGAVRPDDSTDRIRAAARRLSGVETVVERVNAAGAAVRYERVFDAAARLEALAVGDDRIGGFLCRDDTVTARMAVAAAVVPAAGASADPIGDPAAHLRRALHWQRYGRGPVTALHRACAADITRGALRLLARAEQTRRGPT